MAGNLGSTRFAGYSGGRSRASTSVPPLLSTVTTLAGGTDPASGDLVHAYSNGAYRTLQALFAHHQLAASTRTSAAGQRVVYHFARSGSDAFTVDGDSSSAFQTRLRWLDHDPVNLQSSARGALRSITGTVTGVPASLVMTPPGPPGGTHPLPSPPPPPPAGAPTPNPQASPTPPREAGARRPGRAGWIPSRYGPGHIKQFL